MSDEKKVAVEVLKEIARDTNVEPHVRVNAAALLLGADRTGNPTATSAELDAADSGGNPIGGG